MPASEPYLQIEGVAMHFGGRPALAALDLALAPGEFVSVLGPSGCGKSTLLKIVAGLLRPSTGGVRFAAGGGARGDVGFVFQEPTLLPWADVADNVALPLRLAGVPRAARRERVQAALELVELGGFAHAWPRELSGGMQMRVSLARVLAQRPRLLLLDEPFAALDELTRARLNDDLLRLWRHAAWTVLFVTHSVFESVYLSQRVVVLSPRPGRVVAELPVPLPQPRHDEQRLSAAYLECCREVSRQLAAAARPA